MVKDMTPREEQRGTGPVYVWSTIVAIAIGVGLLVWFFVPGFSQSGKPNVAANGPLSNETQGMSVTAQMTKPDPTITPRSTDSTAVARNEKITASATSQVNLTPDQIGAVKSYVTQHGNQQRETVNFTLTVGAAVPAGTRLNDIPPQLAKSLPSFKDDQYIVVGDQFVVVEKKTRRIVAIVPVPA